MSDFQELIRSFPKTREYVRDFFVYGFKTRNEFNEKSPRTYDNERRRLECWLSPFVRKDYASNGSNISLAIDSNLLDTNPLFQVWKTKSFTDNDIVLHFLILDLLQGMEAMTADEITDALITEYDVLIDIQAVRRKCNAYVKEGLLEKAKSGKTVTFSLDSSIALWINGNKNILDALDFYQMAGNFGIIGNVLSEQFDHHNQSFRVKHSFFVHSLEDEILLDLLDAMNKKESVQLEIQSPKQKRWRPETRLPQKPQCDSLSIQDGSSDKLKNTANCVPLQIFVSTRTGRRFLCGYVAQNKRFTCFRLDTIKKVTAMGQSDQYDQLSDKLNQNRQHLWGVSFQGETRRHLDRLTMTLQILEPSETYILNRLKNEGRGGNVTKIARNTYRYEIEVFDCNEMLPWIRTFIGRILSLECTAKSVERRFYQDLNTMYHLYREGETDGIIF